VSRRLAAVGVLIALLAGTGGCTEDDTTPGEGRASRSGTSAWETAAPEAAGFDSAALRRIARDAGRRGSTCFVVARDGALVGEWNWQGVDADAPREVYSVTKSVTSTLIGIAQADGDLRVDDPAATHIRDWRGTDSSGVTVRQLLANDSGRFWTPASDYGDLVQAADRTAYALGLGQQYDPGEVWAYNNAAIQSLDRVLTDATDTVTAELAENRLFTPLGMTATRMTPDESGRSTNVFFGLQSTCRDLARFGQLFAQRGEWDGTQLVPRSWVEAAVGAPSQRLNAAYGLLWWLNRFGPLRDPVDSVEPQEPPAVRAVGRMAPGAPADLFAALGLGGQVVLVDPTSRTVVVRLGDPPPSGEDAYGFADAARVVTEGLLR
jgi:CubicO group peptidase (beta-lactamase class C family)